MKTLYQAVCLGVVRSRPNPNGTDQPRKLAEQVGLELSSPICSNGGWNAITSNPMIDERYGNSLSSNVTNWYGFRPSAVSIDTGEQVRISF